MTTMEERIEEAIVARFFEPSWLIQSQQTLDPSSGMYRTEVVPTQIPSRMSMVAQAIYDQAKAEIIRKVIEQMDIDAIVTEWSSKIAADVVEKLQVKDGYGWQPHPSKTERGKMMDKVYEMVAEEFGRQCVEHLKNTGGLMSVLEAGSE